MAKYIDMQVLTDVRIDKIAQSTLKLKSTGVTILPGMTDIGSAGLRYTSTGKWEYNNGDAWVALSPEGTTLPTTQVIQITASDLVNGVATIQHNLGKVPFGLDYSVTPKAITYADENTMTLDFSDQADTFSGASVWFIGSQQSMLVAPAPTPEWVLSGAGLDAVNGDYIKVSSDQYAEYLGEGMSTSNSICMWTNGSYILYGYNNGVDILTVVPKGWVNTETPLYHYPGISNFDDLTSVSFITVGGTAPAPTITKYTEG